MSGAGKTMTLKFLEDIGFYCTDNLPPALLIPFVEICSSAGEEYDRLALGIDIRGGKLFDELLPAIEKLDKLHRAVTVLYLDSGDDTLLRRYKETRRNHPLAKSGFLLDGIAAEREITETVKKRASYVIDTSSMLARELKSLINGIFLTGKDFAGIVVRVISFGFKHGLPPDADLVFDVRFLPNPFYIPELKPLTGNDKPVADYVMGFETAGMFLERTCSLLDLLMPNYVSEGKTRLFICVGCTGGQHRSVTLANRIGDHLLNQGYSVYVSHRDIPDNVNKAGENPLGFARP